MALVVLFVSCWAAEIPSDEDELPIVEFDFEGHHVSVPLFEKNKLIATEKRRVFEETTIGALLDIAQNLVYDLIKNHRNVVMASGSAIPKIISLAVKKQGEFKKLKGKDAEPVMADGYTKQMSGLMLAILSAKNTSGKTLTDDEVYDKTRVMMEVSKRVPSESPSGLYVDWAKMEIDGERLDKYSEPIIEWFNKSAGRRLCISGAKKIAQLLEKFGSN